MAKGPAVVIIARHGARLDAADKTWHLTSPTPYDPPLTYGGWSQAKCLGLRIAGLLHAREKEAEKANGAHGANADLAHLDFSPLDHDKGSRRQADGLAGKRQRHKFVIHSSPYLRCIQTSTAIAAGIAQFQPPAASTTADPNLDVFPKPHVGPDKILLRIDAFLGEWLSPDYFEDITPPPNSTMMVAGAKADLLRRGDYIEAQPNAHSSKGHFPGGWVKSGGPPTTSSLKSTEHVPFPAMGSLAQALPHRERASSQGSLASLTSRTAHKGASPLSTAHKVPEYIYDPPIPSYAVSPADPIPRGYVAHARDACLDVDFQWDSMRAPQEWGDGGEYGDEWSTMHKRFRRGLGGIMSWYKTHDSMPTKDHFPGFTYREHTAATHHHASVPDTTTNDSDEEEDEELVLILVTHGAGCNALLGAISNQPVLLDVGMASLSMAVRRDVPRKTSGTTLHQRRPSIVDPGMVDDYEMKMLASLDHLRPGVDPARLPLPQSPAIVASPSLEYRRRFTKSGGTNSPIDSPFSSGDSYRGLNSSLGSMRRSSTSGSSSRLLSNHSGGSASPMTGLWSGLRAPTPETPSEGKRSPGHDMVLNFRDQQPKPPAPSTDAPAPAPTHNTNTLSSPIANGNGNINGNGNGNENGNENENDQDKHAENDHVAPLRSSLGMGRSLSQAQAQGLWVPRLQTSQQGLWGPPRLEGVFEHERGPKRRWTVTERDG